MSQISSGINTTKIMKISSRIKSEEDRGFEMVGYHKILSLAS